ncbi:PQQ-dependent sugar dehydrogenase [Nocardiopsis sediminis]|uniref:PQQ-dependent sugar dehydrogenase n=1 Tax=Nocardiopsis sediminis TaxID=1778267 RepID=A0ABV8FIG3_9ACTN
MLRYRDRAPACAAVIAVALLGTACSGSDPGQGARGGGAATDPTPMARLAPPGEPSDIATDLEVPWAIGFLPDGAALVTERDSGRIVRVTPGGETTPVGTVDDVAPRGEGGLLGLAVQPDAGDTPDVYVYYTAEADNRIARMTYDPQNGLGDPEVLVDGIPRAAVHNGGRIVFGPDGLLYAATGDAGDESQSQQIDRLGGKILRMTPDGDPAPDNPFDNLVYSYGHRNVQGLAWDDDGVFYATEFGQDTYDEVNVIVPGGNYGWPEVEGVGDHAGYIDPVVTWTTDEASPSGAAVAGDSLWVAGLRGERLWRVPLTGDSADPVGEPEALFTGAYGRLRAVTTVPGGSAIWVSTSNTDGRGAPRDNDDRILNVPMGE